MKPFLKFKNKIKFKKNETIKIREIQDKIYIILGLGNPSKHDPMDKRQKEKNLFIFYFFSHF